MRRGIGLILLALLAVFFMLGPLSVLCRAETLPSAAVTNAYRYIDLRERTNRNDAPEIDRMLAYLGLPPRLSWCAAFVIWNHKEAAEKLQVKQPLPKLGRVAMLWAYAKNNPLRYQTFTADQVRLGFVQLQRGDIVIWKHGEITRGDFNGHTGLTVKQISTTLLRTVEGNTLPEHAKGNQREGGGVYERNRYIAPGTFSIIGFIRIRSTT